MTAAAAFAERYPCVWHVIEAEGAGCEILYPAATLHRLAGLPEDSANRDEFRHLTLSDGSLAIARPQLMPDARLTPTLSGLFTGRPDAWRAHINQHVFFWLAEDRRDRFIEACVRFRARRQPGGLAAPVILRLDTRRLLHAHCHDAFFSRVNSGSTLRGGARTRRDETTLAPMHTWRGTPAVELAIRAPVPLANQDPTRYAAASNASRCASTNRQSSSASTNQTSRSG